MFCDVSAILTYLTPITLYLYILCKYIVDENIFKRRRAILFANGKLVLHMICKSIVCQ